MRKSAFSLACLLVLLISWLLFETKSHISSNRNPESIEKVKNRATSIVKIPAPESQDEATTWKSVPKEEVLSKKALPVFKSFLRALASVGLSPLDPNLLTNTVRAVDAGKNRFLLNCTFVVDGKWRVSFDEMPETELTTRYVGITSFQQTGVESVYAAVSAGDTNRLALLSGENTMTQDSAANMLRRALESVLHKEMPFPEVHPQKYYGFDMGRWCGRWWKQDKDHWNRLNVEYELVIRTQTATQATLVGYRNSIAGDK